jgi:hypothetical protein
VLLILLATAIAGPTYYPPPGSGAAGGDADTLAGVTPGTGGLAVLDDVSVAAVATTIGVGTGSSPQFTGIELSHASANTLTASGGTLSIEGVALLPTDVELTSIAGLTSAADRLPYYTGSGTAALATYTAAARSIDDDATVAAMRATLGLDDPAVIEQWVVLPGDVSNATTTPTLATGMTFMPAASKTNAVRVICAFTTTNAAEGITWGIRDHATTSDGSGAGYFQARGASASAGVVSVPSIIAGGAGADALGLTSGTGRTAFRGEAIWTADGTPTAVGVYFAGETGTATVQLEGGECALAYKQLN